MIDIAERKKREFTMWHLLSCVISSYCIQSQRICPEEFIQGNCICPNTIIHKTGIF